MADQILSPLIGKLVDYVAVPVGRQFSYLFRYNGNLEEFRRQLKDLELAADGVKLKVEAAGRNGEAILPNVKDWLERVDAVSVESQRFVGEEDAISKCCFNGPLNLKVRYQRSRKAMKKAAEFDRIKKDGRFDSVSLPAPPLQIGSMNNENEFDFESRRSVFNEITDAIKDDGVQMIGIWGMAGIGKTTLVKRVAKYAQDEGLFEEVAMAVVSQNPSVKDIQGQIADVIGLKFTCESELGRAGQLFQRLYGKKILVILDDIWDSIELNDIGIPFGIQHKGCKIILTSRIRDVCEKMRTRKNFEIHLLSEKEALGLFLQNSGIDNQFSEKGRLAENLSEECGRLPICIVIVARGLFNKEQFYWTDMLNRLRNSDPDNKVRAAIELSYNTVKREEEKMFFLLCALFPEDYKIPVGVLLEYGIGLDLFEKVNNVDEALVRAHKLASSLKSSCLLLDEGSEEFVKMHDVVRDVALAIASEGKNVFLVRSVAQWREWPGKTAISLWADYVEKPPDALECPQLQILMLNWCSPGWQLPSDLQLSDNFFAGMKNLIVLDISHMECEQLPQSFAGLENLRTLRLIDCKLGDISTIGKLQNLVSLSFYNSHIKVLPKEVGELSNLTLLDLSTWLESTVIAPGVIQNLSQLEVLNVGSNVLCYAAEDSSLRNANLSELIHLSRLMILEICIPDASMLPDEVLFGNLTKFKVSIGTYEKTIFSSNWQNLKLESLSENELTKAGIKMLMKKAQHLELENISGISVALPSHLGGFKTLKELFVSDCKDVNYVLDKNESEYEPETPSLRLLHLIDLPFLKELSKGEFPSLFVSELERLWLHKLPRFVHLWQFDAKSVALANLTFMSVESCDKLEYVFEHSTAKNLLKLKELEVRYCADLQAIYLTKEEEQNNVINFPQLSHLKLWELENLTSFDSKFASESTLFGKQVIFRALEELDIYKLDRLEKIWHIHSPVELFFQLKVLKLKQCPELLVVFPPQATWALQNLEAICVEDCDMLETLFQSDGVPLTVGDEMVLFPRLYTLTLINLPKLTAILSTTSQNISQATVSFPILEQIHVKGLKSLKKIWHNNVSTKCFSQLQRLHVLNCDQLVEVFPCHLVPNFAVKDHSFFLSNLQQLQLISLPKLKQLNTCESFSLPSLTFVFLDNCPALQYVFDASVANHLENLRSLSVENCSSIVEIVEEKPGRKITLPLLDILCLRNLPCFKVNQSVEFPQLSTVRVSRCLNYKRYYVINVNGTHVRNIQLQKSMSFFESLVEYLKTRRLLN